MNYKYNAKDQGWMAMVVPLLLAWVMLLFLAYHVGKLRHRIAALETERSANK